MMDLPNGTRIYPASETQRLLSAGSGGGEGAPTIIVNAQNAVLVER